MGVAGFRMIKMARLKLFMVVLLLALKNLRSYGTLFSGEVTRRVELEKHDDLDQLLHNYYNTSSSETCWSQIVKG